MMDMITVDMTTKMVIVTIPVRMLQTIPLRGRLLPVRRFPEADVVPDGIIAIN